MKKILIVNKSFETGGIETSLVNMANELQKHYQVDLFVYYPEGTMKERLNPDVNVIEPSWRFKALGMPIKKVLSSKKLNMILFRLFALAWTKLFSNKLPISCAIHHQPKLAGYDMAIAFHQEQRKHATISGFSRFIDGCAEAKVKAAWLHYDNTILDLDSKYNNPFYSKMDKLVFVSKSLAQSFAARFPEFKDKVDYCYNFIDYDDLVRKSKLPLAVPFEAEKFVCFSACRLSEEKAIVRAVNALQSVFRQHDEIVWYIAGDGPEKTNIQNAVKAAQLENQIKLIGYQGNPYAYMAKADLIMNVSYHEAAPMVFLEAKAVGTPVFATRTSSADELLQDSIDAFVCDNNEDAIRERFETVVTNRQLVESAKAQLKSYKVDNDASLEKIRNWME